MTEEQARSWLIDRDVSRETLARLDQFIAFLRAESATQNLIAASTLDAIWSRHIVDSAQLLPLAGAADSWIDLGTGAGFPGLIIATVSTTPTTLVESRRKRCDFLTAAIDLLGIGAHTTLRQTRAETLPAAPFGVISARAFAPLDRLLDIGHRFAGPETRWVLPRGRNAQAELEAARRTWQGSFRIEPSVTDPDSAIIVAEQVRPRKQR